MIISDTMEKSRRGKVELDDTSSETLVLQEAGQYFMGPSVKTKKLVDVLIRCIYIIFQGEKLASNVATDLFFHMTRLFQYKDSTLKRLTYIGIKALSEQAENVYVVTSSLTTDVNSDHAEPAIRASALRALCQITDVSAFSTIERYLKQAIVDKHPVVVSAALSSLIRASQVNPEIIKRYTKEIQEALNSESSMVQYHALGLSYNSCKNDKPAVSSLISHCIELNLKSPLAISLLIRIVSNFIKNNCDEQPQPSYLDYLKDQLNHESELVVYEAANSLIGIKSNTTESLHRSAISHLRNFLTSNKAALRYGSVRSLNELAATSTSDIRFWSIHRIGGVCNLHLLNKRYRPGEHIIGMLDFTNSKVACAKYAVILQCEETQQYELKQEFSLGFKKNDFSIGIPLISTKAAILHCVLSFLFYIADKNYSKTLFEDRAGTIELGPSELDTKLFSCDFPIAVHS